MKVRKTKDIASSAVIGLLLVSTLVIAGNQTSYAKATEQPSAGTATANTSSDKVSAASGNNRFVVWSDETFGSRDILFRRSTDNGATWRPTVNLSNNPGTSNAPLIAVSGSNVYVIWQQFGSGSQPPSISFRASTDNGVNWGSKVKIANVPCTSCTYEVAASENNVYVVFMDGVVGVGEIYLRRSTDAGASWAPVVNLSSNPGDSFDPKITTSGSNIYVIWTQASSSGTSYDIFFRRSTDSGNSWKSKVNLSNDADFSRNARIAASESSVHVVWDGGLYRRSIDSGITWKSVQIIGETDCGIDNPKIAVSGNSIYVASVSSSGELFFCRSTDAGVSWKDSVMVFSSGKCSDENFGLAASSSFAFLTCTRGDENPIMFSRSNDNGASWSAPKDVLPPGRSYAHVLAVTGSTVFIVSAERVDTSSDDAGEGQEVMLIRSTNSGGTWKSPINLSNNPEQSFWAQIGL